METILSVIGKMFQTSNNFLKRTLDLLERVAPLYIRKAHTFFMAELENVRARESDRGTSKMGDPRSYGLLPKKEIIQTRMNFYLMKIIP